MVILDNRALQSAENSLSYQLFKINFAQRPKPETPEWLPCKTSQKRGKRRLSIVERTKLDFEGNSVLLTFVSLLKNASKYPKETKQKMSF